MHGLDVATRIAACFSGPSRLASLAPQDDGLMSQASAPLILLRQSHCSRLHLSPHAYHEIVRVVHNIRPFQQFAISDAALEAKTLREAERQVSVRERALGRHLPAVDPVAAFAIEIFARLERALGGG